MKTKIILTKKDCVVVFMCAVFMLMCMGAIGGGSREHARRILCRTSLKGLGAAMRVYANDFEDEYPVQGGGYDEPGDWKDRTLDWEVVDKDWSDGGNITVGASLYLLVRGSYVGTQSFVCMSSDQKAYDGSIGPSGGTDTGQQLVELWDFGHKADGRGPKNCVSYSYQFPYDQGNGKFFPADAAGPAGMALMADKNPWFDPKLDDTMSFPSTWKRSVTNISNDWDYTGVNEWEILVGNAEAHNRDGQNVLFNDGHTEFTVRSDIGYENDNIYTTWSGPPGETPQDDEEIRIGRGYSVINTGGSKNNLDSWLVNDDDRE